MLEITFKIIANVRRYQDGKLRVSIREAVTLNLVLEVKGKFRTKSEGQFSFLTKVKSPEGPN